MEPKTFQNRAQNLPESRAVRDIVRAMDVGTAKKTEKEHRANKKEGGVPQRRSILSEKVANMAPSWPPKSKQNRRKIDAKIDRKSDASWN